jgi:hypothetical protein
MAKKESLSDGVGFATLKNTFPDASAQLVELMRATLRHAQEITASVGDAELATEQAHTAVTTVDSMTTAAERRVVDAEIEKVTRWLNPAMQRSGNLPAGISATTAPSSNSALAASGDDAALGVPQAGNGYGAGSSNGGQAGLDMSVASTAPVGSTASSFSNVSARNIDVSGDMAEQIETTVMWVQQLLESVHFAESEEGLESGASLLSIVQPGRRTQKDNAIKNSVSLFHEKKEEEEDAEDEAPFFRFQALQAVQARAAASMSRKSST